MPRTILGLETRACINGLNKTDFENVKKIPTLETETDEIKNETIPSLDDRITALEQGGSGENDYSWSDYITFPSFVQLEDVMNEYFEQDEVTREWNLKYDTIVSFFGELTFVPKGFSITDLSNKVNIIDKATGDNLRIWIYNFDSYEFFFNQPEEDTKFFMGQYRWIISNPSDATFTFTNYSGEQPRNLVAFCFKNVPNN